MSYWLRPEAWISEQGAVNFTIFGGSVMIIIIMHLLKISSSTVERLKHFYYIAILARPRIRTPDQEGLEFHRFGRWLYRHHNHAFSFLKFIIMWLEKTHTFSLYGHIGSAFGPNPGGVKFTIWGRGTSSFLLNVQ